jgi:hypothetical protein
MAETIRELQRYRHSLAVSITGACERGDYEYAAQLRAEALRTYRLIEKRSLVLSRELTISWPLL